MFVELPKTHYHRVRPLFAPLAYNLEVPSILDGNTRGVIFVDDLEAPKQALMWDHLMAMFLAGHSEDPEFSAELRDWLTEVPVPQARKYGIDALTIDTTHHEWDETLPRLLNAYRLTRGTRHSYTHTGKHVRLGEIPVEYVIQPVTPQLLARDDLQGQGWLEGWISSYWPTLEHYFQLGIGYVALLEDRAVASLCISVFVTEHAYEFGTATHEDHRNRGLSTAAAGNCINRCLARDIAPIWHCWADNLPSIAVARKIGFKLERTYSVTQVWVP
ncbi:MAG: GNAT family N-acetyltransferase [Anaerolineae bacterium]|nr:GNAT family N-acetyltransferase [Anaerolineae bacterium]